jgi:hypothetical protein
MTTNGRAENERRDECSADASDDVTPTTRYPRVAAFRTPSGPRPEPVPDLRDSRRSHLGLARLGLRELVLGRRQTLAALDLAEAVEGEVGRYGSLDHRRLDVRADQSGVVIAATVLASSDGVVRRRE